MARGRCQCGAILAFRKGPEGYKTRCPTCGAVVRLRIAASRRRRAKKRSRELAAVPTVDQPTPPPQRSLSPSAYPRPLGGEIVLEPLMPLPGLGPPRSPWRQPLLWMAGGVLLGAAMLVLGWCIWG
jgi:hypothetical protein